MTNETQQPHVWTKPEENWSMMPNEFIDIMPQIETLAEMKVVLYVLRHTWGYSDQFKKITMDEFVNGRKRKDGTRIDNGLGMTPASIRDGIKRAIAHGLIIVTEDNTDLARQKRYYSLACADTETEDEPIAEIPDETGGQKLTPNPIQGVKDCPPGGQKLTIGGSKINHRTEKETIERNSKKEKDDHLPGSLLRTLLDDGGFVYRDRNLTEIAVRLESDYTTEQLVRAVGAAKEAHTKQIMLGGRGIMAPAAYVATILADEAKKPPPPQKRMVRIFNQYTDQYEMREVMA